VLGFPTKPRESLSRQLIDHHLLVDHPATCGRGPSKSCVHRSQSCPHGSQRFEINSNWDLGTGNLRVPRSWFVAKENALRKISKWPARPCGCYLYILPLHSLLAVPAGWGTLQSTLLGYSIPCYHVKDSPLLHWRDPVVFYESAACLCSHTLCTSGTRSES
jgi:hypothetical protein